MTFKDLDDIEIEELCLASSSGLSCNLVCTWVEFKENIWNSKDGSEGWFQSFILPEEGGTVLQFSVCELGRHFIILENGVYRRESIFTCSNSLEGTVLES